MLKKKQQLFNPKFATITTRIGMFYLLSKNVVINAYFDNKDEKDTLVKINRVTLSDLYDVLPDLNLLDLSTMNIKTDKKNVSVNTLRILHSPKRYEKYYTFEVLGETEVIQW